MVTFYKVVWLDASGGGNIGWRPLEELITTKPARVVSCGIKIHEDDLTVTICPHVILNSNNEVEQGDAEIVIPKQWLLSCNILNTETEHQQDGVNNGRFI